MNTLPLSSVYVIVPAVFLLAVIAMVIGRSVDRTSTRQMTDLWEKLDEQRDSARQHEALRDVLDVADDPDRAQEPVELIPEPARTTIIKMLAGFHDERSDLVRRLRRAERQIAADDRRYLLLRAYATQGLTQGKVSFIASLGSAAVGFAVIVSGAVIALTGSTAVQAAIPVIAGTVIDAVALLFFAQDKRHQKTMFDFFERLRADHKVEQSLELLRETTDDEIRARIQAALVLHFAEVPNPLDVLRVADRRSGEDKPASE